MLFSKFRNMNVVLVKSYVNVQQYEGKKNNSTDFNALVWL
jgi:hypothetical protein